MSVELLSINQNYHTLHENNHQQSSLFGKKIFECLRCKCVNRKNWPIALCITTLFIANIGAIIAIVVYAKLGKLDKVVGIGLITLMVDLPLAACIGGILN